jgi:hypothetical protein
LKVVWRAKNISGGLLISGGFPTDLTKSARALFCLADLAEFWRFWCLNQQKNAFSSIFLLFLVFFFQLIKMSKLQNILKEETYSVQATPEMRPNSH